MRRCALCSESGAGVAWNLCQRCAALVNLFVERERPRFEHEIAILEASEWARFRALLLARAITTP